MATPKKGRRRITPCKNCGGKMIEDTVGTRNIFFCTKKIRPCSNADATEFVDEKDITEEVYMIGRYA